MLPGGRLLEQRDVAWTKLNEIPGVSCVKPQGALYVVPAARPRGLRHPRRRAARPGPAAAGEDPGHPGHRVQLAHTRPPAHRHAAVGPRPRQRHRAARQLPGQLPPVSCDATQVAASTLVARDALARPLAHPARPFAAGTAGRQDRRRSPGRHRRRRAGRRRSAVAQPAEGRHPAALPERRGRRGHHRGRPCAVQRHGATAASPSVGAVLTTDPAPAEAGDAAVRADAGRHRLRAQRGRQHAAGVQRRARASPTSPSATTSGSAARSTQPGTTSYAFYDYERTWPLIALAAAFAVVIVAVARWRGLRALVGIVVAFAGAGGVPAARPARRRARDSGRAGRVGGDPVRGDLPGARGEPAHQRGAARHADRAAARRGIVLGAQSNWRT